MLLSLTNVRAEQYAFLASLCTREALEIICILSLIYYSRDNLPFHCGKTWRSPIVISS